MVSSLAVLGFEARLDIGRQLLVQSVAVVKQLLGLLVETAANIILFTDGLNKMFD